MELHFKILRALSGKIKGQNTLKLQHFALAMRTLNVLFACHRTVEFRNTN